MQHSIQQSTADFTKIFVEEDAHSFLFILVTEIKIMKEKDVERLHYNQYKEVPLHTADNILYI